ncbi:MAG TPA: hypothetical protein VGD87_10810 [Archangium sp.]
MNAARGSHDEAVMRVLWLCLLFLGCAGSRSVVRDERGGYSARDYLQTAFDTLSEAETDTNGHRIRAAVETRAALERLDDRARPRRVPYEGEPSLAVAFELLQRSEPELPPRSAAQQHAQRALEELRLALTGTTAR